MVCGPSSRLDRSKHCAPQAGVALGLFPVTDAWAAAAEPSVSSAAAVLRVTMILRMNSPCLLARLHLRGPGLAITAIWALSSCAPLTSAAHEYVTYTKTPW